MNYRSVPVAYLFWFFLGFFGAHRFYLGHFWWGVAYLLTGAFGGIGWVIDLFLIPGCVRDHNELVKRSGWEKGLPRNNRRLAKGGLHR